MRTRVVGEYHSALINAGVDDYELDCCREDIGSEFPGHDGHGYRRHVRPADQAGGPDVSDDGLDPAAIRANLTLFPSLRWSEYWWPLAVGAGSPSEGSAMAIDLPGRMRLARGAFDVGQLDHRHRSDDRFLASGERQLPIERIFEPTPGVTQYKLTIHGAVTKVNHVAGGASQVSRLGGCAPALRR